MVNLYATLAGNFFRTLFDEIYDCVEFPAYILFVAIEPFCIAESYGLFV
jgi:hypothetical protein